MSYLGIPVKRPDPSFESTATMAGFEKEDIDNAETIIIEHSSFNDPGEDWNKYTLFTKNHTTIKSITKPGY